MNPDTNTSLTPSQPIASSTTPPASATVPANAAAAAPDANAPLVASDKHTPGESLYKWTVHGGINFLLNESLGMLWMWAGQFGEHSKIPGAPLIYKMTNKVTPHVEKFLEETIRLKPKTAKIGADQIVDIGLLTMGGNILMFPIKMIEEHKLFWVKKADAFLDTIHGHPNDLTPQMKADRAAAYDRIEHEDKPSWGRVIGARASSILFNTATLTVWKLTDKHPDVDRRGTGRISNWVADVFSGTKKEIGHVYERATARWWTNTAILETLSTMVTASIFYVKYEILDRKEKKAELKAKGIEPTHMNTAPNDLIASTFVLPSAEAPAVNGAPAHPNASNATSQTLAAQATQQASPESTMSHAARVQAERGGAEHQRHGGDLSVHAHASRGESHAAAIVQDKEKAAHAAVVMP